MKHLGVLGVVADGVRRTLDPSELVQRSASVLVLDDEAERGARLVAVLAAAGYSVEMARPHDTAALAKSRDVDFVLVGQQHRERSPIAVRPSHRARPRSAVGRWATLVLKACESDGDLKTLADWAGVAGMSYSNLCEICRMVGVKPHAARDFARMLSAVLKAATRRCHPSVLLDVSDRRTLRLLLEKAGIHPHEATSVARFLDSQQFVPGDSEALRVLRGLLLVAGAPGERPVRLANGS